MTEESKQTAPAYATYKSFTNLINDLRGEPIPPTIEYSVVKGSNSGKATMLASLKALRLIDSEKRPSESFKALIRDTENYEANLRKVLHDAYPYLFDGEVDLNNTTTEQVVKLFTAAGASGSTVTKGMSFFINAAKEAGIGVSSRVKPPQAAKSNGSKRRQSSGGNAQSDNNSQDESPAADSPPEGTEKVSFTLRGMPDVVVYFPGGLEDDEQIKRVIRATVFNLENYYGVQMDWGQ